MIGPRTAVYSVMAVSGVFTCERPNAGSLNGSSRLAGLHLNVGRITKGVIPTAGVASLTTNNSRAQVPRALKSLAASKWID